MPINMNKVKELQGAGHISQDGIKKLQGIPVESKQPQLTNYQITGLQAQKAQAQKEKNAPKKKEVTFVEAIKSLPGALISGNNKLPELLTKKSGLQTSEEYAKTLPRKSQEYYKTHPLAKAIVTSPAGQVVEKIANFNDVAGESMRNVTFGDNSSTATTGNKGLDTAAKIVGGLESVFLPSGDVAAPVNVIRGAAEGITAKAAAKTGSKVLANKYANKAVTGALESVPYTAEQIAAQNKEHDKPRDYGDSILQKVKVTPSVKGNIDLNDRPIIKNSDGSISTVFSMTIWPDDDAVQKYGNKFAEDKGKYILIPGVRKGLNRKMTIDEAYQWYQKTGEHLGKFNSDADAEKYAENLHEDQALLYSNNTSDKIKSALKTLAINTALGAAVEPAISAVGALAKKTAPALTKSEKVNKGCKNCAETAVDVEQQAQSTPNPKFTKAMNDVSGVVKPPVQATKETGNIIPRPAETTAQKGAQEVPVQFKGAEPGSIEYNPIKIGMQTQEVRGVNPTKTPKFEFSNPEIESTHKANKGIKEATVPEKVRQIATDVKNMFTRPIGTLPYTKENAELYKELVKLPKVRAIATDDTIRTLDDITKGMDKNGFDMFERRVLLEDLAEEANRGNKLPNKWTPEEVQKELVRLDEAMPANVKEAINKRTQYWNKLKDDYIKSMKDIGIDMSDTLNRENYFRHQVLDYVQAQNSLAGTGKRLKSPTGRSYTKARTGEYEGNINTDYLQSEFEVMAQMKHDTEIANTIKAIDLNYNIADKIKAQAKQMEVNWKDLIPEGYTTWQPKQGNAFYMSQPLGAEIVEQSLAMRGIKLADIKDFKLKVALEDIMNDLADQTSVLAMGGKRKEWVVKQDVADTLNNLTKSTTTNALSRLSKNIQSTWKRWILTLNPKSVIKYNVRNLSGDLDGMLAGNPSAIKKGLKSAAELREAMVNGKFTPELKSWYDRGGYQSLLYAQEISQVNKQKPFEKFRDLSKTEKVTKPLRQYADITQNLTNFREAIGRYAAYLDYFDQLKNGKLKNYGASRPEIINGLKSNEDKAFKLSNDLFGAYDEVSQAGQVIRNHLIPFYSWMEINMKRYKNLFKNAFTDGAGKTAALTGKTVAKFSGKTALKVGSIFAMTTALAAWNQLMYPGLEDQLPEDVRNQPHVIFGKDKDGNVRYFSRLGSLNDFLGWFGLDSAPQDVRDIMNGKMTVQDFLTEAIKSPVNKIAGGISPAYKTPAELATEKKLYPDVFDSTNIRDKAQYAAQSVGLKDEYDVVAGKPRRPYFNSLSNAMEYKADPEEQAYYSILDLKAKYKDKVLGIKSGGGLYGDKKSDALYNYKLALRYKDETAKKKYLNQYFQYGGTEKGLTQSLKALNPLYGLNAEQQAQFFGKLTAKDRDRLKQAMKFYNDILSPGDDADN